MEEEDDDDDDEDKARGKDNGTGVLCWDAGKRRQRAAVQEGDGGDGGRDVARVGAWDRIQRSMSVFGDRVGGADHVQGTIDGVRPDWAHFEGYYVYKPTIVETMERLKGAGAKISFDFASFDVIASQRDLFERVLDRRLIDVLFCNEQEAVAFSSSSVSSAPSKNRAAALSPAAFAKHMAGAYGLTMVVSRGASGCVAAAWDHDRGCVVEASAPAPTVEVVDTIGAGDHFSAGFLYALSHGGSLEAACACGCIAGAAAVQVAGSNVDGEAMRRAARDIADRLKTG